MSVHSSKLKTPDQLIDELMAIHPKGYDLSLGRITNLLEKLGNPQNKLPPIIHVAGTNGKGSAIAFTRSILEAAGLRAHVHTSPHLVKWNERYRLGFQGGGKLVEDAVLADAISRVAVANGGEAITVFEVLTVVTFILFSEHPADVCLIEVGLGGRFDATNVMKETALTIITPISIDHETLLGDKLAKIAFEKAGIIKRKTPLIVGPQEDEALEVIEQQASKNMAPMHVSGQDFHGAQENGRLIYQDDETLFDLDLPPLPGEHNVANATTAIAASKVFMDQLGKGLSAEIIDAGLKATTWPGRMQKLTHGKLLELAPSDSEIWLDGGHNPGAAAIIARTFDALNAKDPRPFILICGMLNTKDPSGYFEKLKGLVDQFYTVPIITSDAGIPPKELAKVAKSCGLEGRYSASLREALQSIKIEQSPRILISGSLYLVGSALEENGTPPQ